MKFCVLSAVLAMLVVLAECKHTFLGTNVGRTEVYHYDAKYNAKIFQKRVENIYYAMPSIPSMQPRVIQGILAVDRTYSGASANVTQGGLGYNYVNLRMKSDRGKELHYDIYVYA